ncbi:uncharacterized protein [Halyomorpha halys]|uniref:uncharacterized protein n=1 Tax=Halyomorpha halys TaxID=286706 RepID=UPI0006D4CBD7|nr:uncharacterized protein LOC106679827 [Halyomorpha halys]
MSFTSKNKVFWREFFNMYRNLPELWKVKSEVYRNRNMKDAAYDKLVAKMKEIDQNADRALVRSKINAIRTCYRRELKKIYDSVKSGVRAEDIYVPSLWYFNDIDFLRDHEAQIQETFSTDFKEEVIATDFRPPPSKVLKQPEMSTEMQLIAAAEKLVNSTETKLMDSWESFGSSVGGDLRNLESKQQTIAQKLISDVIFLAKLGKLLEGAMVVAEPPTHLVTSSRYSTPPLSNASVSSYHDENSLPQSSFK